jgi:folylpolyglutamate synthase/dihydropteroate synthase
MNLVEMRFDFPEPGYFHNRRTAWLLEHSRLEERLAGRSRIAVAGSAGKASTARFLAFILAEWGRVALATKPPLRETPEGNLERYQTVEKGEARWMDGVTFAAYADELAPHVEQLLLARPDLGPPAPYDLRAFIVGLMCSEEDLICAIQEANIGLLEDPLGVFPTPTVTMLTPIGDDHASLLQPPQEMLHLGKAAGPVWHKAGGLAPAPVVIGRQRPDLVPTILHLAGQRGAQVVALWGRDFHVENLEQSLQGTRGTIVLGEKRVAAELRVLGGFQLENAAQAAATAWWMFQTGFLAGDEATALERIRVGLAQADSPGRLQVLRSQGPIEIYTIGGNSTKLEASLAAIEELSPPRGQWIACATFLDRIQDLRVAVECLAGRARLSGLMLTCDKSDPRSLDADPHTLASWVRELRPDLTVWVETDLPTAIVKARAHAMGSEDVLLLVGNTMGSHFI